MFFPDVNVGTLINVKVKESFNIANIKYSFNTIVLKKEEVWIVDGAVFLTYEDALLRSEEPQIGYDIVCLDLDKLTQTLYTTFDNYFLFEFTILE